ncbi:MAG: alpha-2-macroglobulin, partial [Acidobacteriia bacterium]|nr:alpha-2-macroglobulin [Terriglobia bacterium]
MEHIKRSELTIVRLAALWAAVCLLGVLCSVPARAAEPYFSVSTDRTFQPGQKATIHLYTRDVEALEFRLYHVNEPTVFFEKLGDVHGFGLRSMSPKEEIDERTWIERFHDWKRDALVRFRRFCRGQFSSRSRTEFREAQGREGKKSNVSPTALFAQIPVLNSRQLVARWQQEMPPKFYSQRQDVPIEHLETGVYVIEATDGKLRAYTVLIVSDLALVIKNAPGQVLAYATDRREGAPVPNTQVDLWGSKKQQVSGQTDNNGLALMTVSAERLEDIRIIGTHGKDVALIAPYYLSLSSNPAQDWTGYLYTDRPVYRPGHTVHFKGILRARNSDQFRAPAGEQVQIVVNDPNNKQVYQGNAAVTAFGGIHGDFTLATDVALGYYSINVRSKAGVQYSMNGSFYVEEYKKPEYEVKVTPDKPRVLEGEAISATIEAKYYFGEPAAGAQVKYVVHRATSWSYLFGDEEDMGPGGEGDFDGGGGGEESEYAGDQLSEQSGKLDANGRLHITVPTTVSDHKYDYRYRIEARITDESRREISGHNSVLATYGSFQVGVQADKYLYTEGETIHLSALAKDYDSNPVQTAYHLEMVQHEYRQGKYEETVTATADGQTGKDGSGKTDMQAKSGSYLRITARTPEGRVVQGQTWLWIVSPGHALWRENQQQLQIIADKKSYKPGDTAQLLVMTNVPQAYLLITTEGQSLKSKRVEKVTSPTAMISVPITGNDEPNMYVSVAFVHNDTLFTGSKNLKVPATEKKLNITIEPSQPQFKPGEAARYNITALDAAGKPVVGEFSLGVVDESIYAVRPDATGDIHDFFYGSVGNFVRVESSFS